jgi:hypothetical protein
MAARHPFRDEATLKGGKSKGDREQTWHIFSKFSFSPFSGNVEAMLRRILLLNWRASIARRRCVTTFLNTVTTTEKIPVTSDVTGVTLTNLFFSGSGLSFSDLFLVLYRKTRLFLAIALIS